MTLKLSLREEKTKRRADDMKNRTVIAAIYWVFIMWQAPLKEFY